MDVNIGMRLREVREAKGLKQKEVAADMSIAANVISRYETGERTPDPTMLARFAKYYGTTSDYLLGLTDYRQKEKLFGDRLKILREQRGQNISEIAENVGLSESHIRTYENGEWLPDENVVKLLANYYAVSKEYLLGLTDNPAIRTVGIKSSINEVSEDTVLLAKQIEALSPQERKAVEAMLEVLKAKNEKGVSNDEYAIRRGKKADSAFNGPPGHDKKAAGNGET